MEQGPGLPCQGMGCEKVKQIGPLLLRRRTPDVLYISYCMSSSPRKIICGLDISPFMYKSEVALLVSRVDRRAGDALD